MESPADFEAGDIKSASPRRSVPWTQTPFLFNPSIEAARNKDRAYYAKSVAGLKVLRRCLLVLGIAALGYFLIGIISPEIISFGPEGGSRDALAEWGILIAYFLFGAMTALTWITWYLFAGLDSRLEAKIAALDAARWDDAEMKGELHGELRVVSYWLLAIVMLFIAQVYVQMFMIG